MTQPIPPQYQVIAVPTSIDYTSKDWLGLTTSMLAYAQQIMPDWDTSSEGDMGVALIELFAYAGDILSYYGDRNSQEAYLPTATQRVSLLNIAQLLGYVPSNGTPAIGTVTFQTSNPGTAVSIPAGTQVSSSFNAALDQPVIYQTLAPVTVAANGGTQTVAVSQGITETLVLLGTSDGTAGQVFALPQQGVIDGTTTVYVQSSTGTSQWTQVQYIIDSGPADQVFTIFVDALGSTNVQFGDNINGLIPATGLSVYASYVVGVGSAGNCAAGLIGLIVNPITGVTIPTLSDNITFQSSAMTGGSDPETNDQIRANAPVSFRTQLRAVSLQDFADLALQVPGVIAAEALANHSTSVSLFILGPGGQAPTTALSTAVLAYFQGKTLAGVTLSVLPPSLIPVDVGSSGNNVELQVAPNYSQAVVLPNVQTALTALLTPPNTSFGQLLNLSDIINAIMSVAGVAYVTVPVFTREDVTQAGTTAIQFRVSEIPVPGNWFLNASGGI